MLETKLIAAAVCIIIGAIGGGWLAWDIQGARLDHLKAADAAAEQERLKEAAAESLKALNVERASVAKQNEQISLLNTQRAAAETLLTSLNDRIAHAPQTPSHCGPLRTQVEGQ